MLSRSALSVSVAVVLALAGFSQGHEDHKDHKDHHKNKSPYHLVENYKPKHFFEKFLFYTGGDPTYGFVQYVNHTYAKQNGLINTFDDRVVIGVDDVNTYSPDGPGRPSVRLESHKTYTHGLFILDLNHMPYGCGAWPAFWTVGPNWPSQGEIDIIEGVNTNDYNLATLHTDKNCSVAGSGQAGNLVESACNDGNSETGCSVLAKNKKTNNYGHGFNHAGGGVYAMEWTSEFIRTWHFPRHRIPKSIKNGEPDPTKFGLPQANFEGSCDFDQHFRDHSIVFDVTFCGQFAGDAYGQSKCPNASGGNRACMDFVGNNPGNFTHVKWDINHLKVYQLKGDETSYLTGIPTAYTSVIPLASTLSSQALSSFQIPGMGHTKHVPSHTLSVASTHKSNKPEKTTSSHKPSSTKHSKTYSATKHSKTSSATKHSITSTPSKHSKSSSKSTTSESTSRTESSSSSTISTASSSSTERSSSLKSPVVSHHKPSATPHRVSSVVSHHITTISSSSHHVSSSSSRHHLEDPLTILPHVNSTRHHHN